MSLAVLRMSKRWSKLIQIKRQSASRIRSRRIVARLVETQGYQKKMRTRGEFFDSRSSRYNYCITN